MIPDGKRWAKWSMPSKATYVSLWVGLAGLVIGVIGGGLSVYFYLNPPASAPTPSDEYVRRTNPVHLRIERVELMRWLGDQEDSITVTLVNDAPVPVDNIEIDLGDGTTFFPRFESQEFKSTQGRLSIPARSQMKVPMAGIDTLGALLSKSICAVATEDPGFQRPASCKRSAAMDWMLMTVTVRYATIFGERKTDHTRIHVYAIPREQS